MKLEPIDTSTTAGKGDVMVSCDGPEVLWVFLDPVTRNLIGYSEVGPEHARDGEVIVRYRRVEE